MSLVALGIAPISEPTADVLRNVLIAVILLAVIAIADVILIAIWSRDSRRERPILAPRWSLAHLYLGFQGWLILTIALGVPLSILVSLVLTRLERLAVPLATATAWSAMPMLVIQNLAMAGVVLFFVRTLYHLPMREAGLSGQNLARGLALGAGLGLLVIPLSDLVGRLSAVAIHAVIPPSWEDALRAFQELTNIQRLLLEPLHSPIGLAALVLVVGVLAPLGEEIFFRGFAHRVFRARFGLLAGSVASAALFALIHVSPVGLYPIFLIGLVLAYLYERTGSLAAPFALHAVNNSFAVIVAYFSPDFTFWPFIRVPE